MSSVQSAIVEPTKIVLILTNFELRSHYWMPHLELPQLFHLNGAPLLPHWGIDP